MLLVCFRLLLCLGCSFVIVGDTYVVYWLGGSCWFVGCWFCLFGSCLRFGALGVHFGMFVLSRWSGACCFLFFDSALQGWGLAAVVGDSYWFFFVLYGVFFFGLLLVFFCALRCSAPAPRSRHAVVLFALSSKADIYYSMRFWWCFTAGMKENSCMQNCSRITCEIAIFVVFLLE
jgi:hypothetical protein